jgi:hypothetical protein
MCEFQNKAINTLNRDVGGKNPWPRETQIQDHVQRVDRPIVVPVPQFMFAENATTFGQVRIDNHVYNTYALAFQMWVRVLSVAAQRYEEAMVRNPVEVYFECLPDYIDRPLEYRMFIFEPPRSKFPLADIYHELCKVFNEHGKRAPGVAYENPVGFIPEGDRTVAVVGGKKGEAAGKFKPDIKKKSPEAEKDDEKNNKKGGTIARTDLWTMMTNVRAMLAVECVIAHQDPSLLSNDTPIVDPRLIYSISNAILCCTHNHNTGLGVKANARNIMNYVYNYDPQDDTRTGEPPDLETMTSVDTSEDCIYVLRKSGMVYKVPNERKFYDGLYDILMPHVQFSPKNVAFSEYINKMAAEVDSLGIKVEYKKIRRDMRRENARLGRKASADDDKDEEDENKQLQLLESHRKNRLQYTYNIDSNGLGYRDDYVTDPRYQHMSMEEKRKHLAEVNAEHADNPDNKGYILDVTPEFAAPMGADYNSYNAKSIARRYDDMSRNFKVSVASAALDVNLTKPTVAPGERDIHDDDRLESITKIFNAFKEIATRYLDLRNEEIKLDEENLMQKRAAKRKVVPKRTRASNVEDNDDDEEEVEVVDEDEDEDEEEEDDELIEMRRQRDRLLEDAKHTYNCRVNYIMDHCALMLEQHTFCEDTGVSRTLNLAHRAAFEQKWFEKLRHGDFEFIPTDPTMTPGSNYFIQMVTRFQKLEMVTFHAMTATIITIASTNGFNRDMKEPNETMCVLGDKASGKSYLMERVKKNTLDEAWTNATAKSDKSGFNNTKDVHMFRYNDDTSLLHLATNKDSRVAEADRQLKTNGRNDYTYTEVDPKRRVVTATAIWKGFDVSGSNTGPAEVELAAGRSGSAAISATISRTTWLSVNTVRDSYYSVIQSNSKNITTPELIKNRDHARMENSLIWLMCGHVHMYLELFQGHFTIDMTAADYLIPVMLAKLGGYGITEADNRQVPKIMRWCKEWVIRRTIVETYFICSGSAFNKIYRMSELRKIPFVCREEDVVLAFSAYFSSFYPEETGVFIKVLSDNVFKSSNANWKGVKFMDPTNKRADDEARLPLPVFTSPEADARVFEKGMRQAGGRGGNLDKATSDAISRTARVDFRDANVDADTGAGNTPPSRFHYVAYIGKSRYEFSSLVASLSKENANYDPSTCQISHIIQMLHERVIETRPHYMKKVTDSNGKQKEIPHMCEDAEENKVKLRGIEFLNGNTYVNIELLRDGLDYGSLCINCIKAIEFRKTVPRRVLTCIPHAKYRWLPRVIELTRVERELVTNNPSYLSPIYQLILSGNIDPEKRTPLQKVQYIEFDEDFDTACLKRWIANGTITKPNHYDIVSVYHPTFLTKRQREMTEARSRNGELSQFVCFSEYPKHLVDEYNDIHETTGNMVRMKGQSGFNSQLVGNSRMIESDKVRRDREKAIADTQLQNKTSLKPNKVFSLTSHKRLSSKYLTGSTGLIEVSPVTRTAQFGSSFVPFNDDSAMPFDTYIETAVQAKPVSNPQKKMFDMLEDNDDNNNNNNNNNNKRRKTDLDILAESVEDD